MGLGAGLEGETAVMIGSAIARHGLFRPAAAAAAAWMGSFLADQLFFGLARSQRDNRYVQRVNQKRAFTRALGFVDRHPIGFAWPFGSSMAFVPWDRLQSVSRMCRHGCSYRSTAFRRLYGRRFSRR